MKPKRNSCLFRLHDPEDEGTTVLWEVRNYSTNNTESRSICSNTTVTTTNVTTQSNISYRILANLVNITCDVPWNWKAGHSMSNCDSSKLSEGNVGAPVSVRRVSLIQSCMIMTSICLMELKTVTSQHLAHPWSRGRYSCTYQAGNPICSACQAICHSHVNLPGTLGSRIWVKVRKSSFFINMTDHCGGGSKPKLHLEWGKIQAGAANYRSLPISPLLTNK